MMPSPIQLTQIRDLPNESNIDAITLSDILGDPMIRECWQFNYLLDIDFIISVLDPDVSSQVAVKVIHGFWKKEDSQRISLEEACKRHANVQLFQAYMPERFGTHHSKMMILIRHDDCAQVIIHTANMIRQDWTNLTQAVWRSPLLPLLPPNSNGSHPFSSDTSSSNQTFPIGTGERFKHDLLAYVQAYGSRLKTLRSQLTNYDFSAIRAALVASTPSRLPPHHTSRSNSSQATTSGWGWPVLRNVLSAIPCTSLTAHLVLQVSSIATLDGTGRWLANLLDVLRSSSAAASAPPRPDAAPNPTPSSSRSGHVRSNPYATVEVKANVQAKAKVNAKQEAHILFPTADSVRRSLDGYASGASIHMKTQSAAQRKQLDYLRPQLRHWGGVSDAVTRDGIGSSSGSGIRDGGPTGALIREAGRRRAAPHIKTYIRFKDEAMREVEWAMVTSANLSKQAWGEMENKDGNVAVASWEIGVVVWPALFADDGQRGKDHEGKVTGERVRMVPVFRKDVPTVGDLEGVEMRGVEKVVGFRMPYDLPLVPYGMGDEPWCATTAHREPDWTGHAWGGYSSRA